MEEIKLTKEQELEFEDGKGEDLEQIKDEPQINESIGEEDGI